MYNTIFHALRKRGGLAKLLSLFAFLLLAGALPAHADETVRQQDADGYYRLQTAEDLQWFADLVYDGNYKACGRLYADVNLATLPDACWRPIGGVQPGYTHIAHVFKGKFDGQNHIITGLKIRPFVETGLFGRTDSATIENVIVEKAALCDTVISLDYSKNSKNIYGQQMAVIVGNAQHTVVRNCHVRNALVTPVSLKGEQKWYMVGGICGSAGDECSVQDCSMSGYVMTNHEGAGGIVGYLENSEISNCSVLASENGITKVSATNYVGGICGAVKYRSAAVCITGCTVTDSISLYASEEGATGIDTICGAEQEAKHIECYKGYYEIYTPANLQEFASKVNGGETSAKARLMCNINMAGTGDFTPIGSESRPFCGEFDGKGHTIDSLTVKNQKYAGLFGYIKDGSVANLTLSNPTLLTQNNDYLGFIVGQITQNPNHATPVGYIENCHVTNGSLLRNGLGEPNYVGGIAGKADMSAAIRQCSFQGIIKAHEEEIGGIVGELHSGATVSQCFLMGPSTVWGDDYVGGIVGYVKDANTDVTDCYVDQNAGRTEIHASEGNEYGTIWGKNANSKAEVAHTKYTEDDVVYEQTGRYVNTEEGRATETRVVGVKKKGKDYHVYADIGETYDYKTSVIDNMNGAATVDFWDNSSSKSAATACNWIDIEIADYAFDSSLKGLYMRYFMTAGTDHWIMLGPKDVRPKGKNMLAYAPEAKVYVDAEYYEAFITDSLWSAYKDRIVPVTSMRNTEKKQEGTYYAYDYNRDKAGTFLTKSPDGKHTVYQLHVVGGEDKSELRVYKDIGQDYDYNTTKIWASTFRGRQNLQTVRFSEIIEAAYHTYGPMQIALGDSCFADCPKLGHFEVILYSNEGDDHVEYIHPSEMPIGKGVFANSPNVKIFVARELVDEFKNDTVYGWAAYKDLIHAGDFGNNDFNCKGVWYSYYTSADGQTQYTNSDNDTMEKMLTPWTADYRNFTPMKVLEYGNDAKIRYVFAKGVVASEINENGGELRLYCDIGGYHNYKTLALAGNGFQGQNCIKSIVFEDCYSDRGNAKTGLSLVIPDEAFKGCKELKELSMFYYVTKGTNHYEAIKPSQIFIGEHVFDDVNSDFKIRVSPELYYDYITDPNWSQYKDRILAADFMPVDKEPVVYGGITYDYAAKALNTTSSPEIMKMQASLINIPIVALEVYMVLHSLENMFAKRIAKSAVTKALEGTAKEATQIADGTIPFIQTSETNLENTLTTEIVTKIGDKVFYDIPDMTSTQFARQLMTAYLKAVSQALLEAGIFEAKGFASLTDYAIGALLTAASSSTASLSDDVVTGRLQNYIFNRQLKRFTKDTSWMVSGLNWVSTRQRTNIDNMYVKEVNDQESVTIGVNPTYREFWTSLFNNTKSYQTVAIGRDAFHNKSKLKEVKFKHSNYFALEPLFPLDLTIPDSCFAGCNNLKEVNLVIDTRFSSEGTNGTHCYKALTPDNFILLGDMFAGIDSTARKNIKIIVGEDVLQDFLDDERWAQYKDMFQTVSLTDRETATEWGCRYTYTFDNNTMRLTHQSGTEDIMHVDIYAPNDEQLKAKDGLAALVSDIGVAYSYQLDNVKAKAFKGNENLKTLDITDLTGYVGDMYSNTFRVMLQDSAFADCKNFRDFNVIYQETDGTNKTTAIGPNQIGLGEGVFSGCDNLRIKFCIDKEMDFLKSVPWIQYIDKFTPCFFAPLDTKVYDLLKEKGYCFKTALVNENLDHIDATRAKPEELKTLFKGRDIESFDEFRAFASCGLTQIYDNMFEGCSSLQTLMLPDSIQTIGENAFKDCKLLYKLSIPKKVESIASTAFAGSGLKEFQFNNPVPIDIDAAKLFAGLDAEFVIYVADSVADAYKAKWAAVADHINGISKRQSTIKTVVVKAPGTLAKELGCTYTYEDDAKLSGNYAQYEALRIIGPIDGRDIGVLRFMGGVDVEYRDKTVGHLKYLDLYEADIKKGYEFDRSGENRSVEHDNRIEPFMFSYLDKIQTLILPKSVTEIGSYGLAVMENLNTLVVGDNTSKINLKVIQDSKNINTLVMLPKKVPETLHQSWAMEDEIFGDGNSNYRIGRIYAPAESIDAYQHPYYSAYSDSTGVAFEDAHLADALKKSHVFIPTDLLQISDLTGVVCNDTTIHTFNELYCCADSTLADQSLTGMSNLNEVTLPYQLESITADAFKGCSSLRTIYAVNTEPATLAPKAFNDLPGNFVVIVPDGYVETYRKAWPEYADHIQGYRAKADAPIVVHLDEKNTLAKKLGLTVKKDGDYVASVSGESLSTIKALKICGPISGEDIAVIRMLGGRDPYYSDQVYSTNLSYLDLYDAQIEADNTYFAYNRHHMFDWETVGSTYKIDNDNEVPKCMLWGCNNLQTVILPRTATKICDDACYDMYSLKTLVIGDETNDVDGNDAFGDCEQLTKMIFLSKKKPELNHDAFTDPLEGDNFKVANIYVRKSILGDYTKDEQYTGHANNITAPFDDDELFRAFGSHAVASEDDLQHVDSLTQWFDAFPNVKDLRTLSKTSVTKLDDATFAVLKDLKYVTLPKTLRSVADNTFAENGNLRWLDLSACDSLTTDVAQIDLTSGALLYLPETAGSCERTNAVYGANGALQCNDYFLTDSRGYDVPKAFTAKKVTFGREFTPRTYSTVTLPFTLKEQPDGFKFYTVDTDSTRSGEIFFKPTTDGIAANSPYMVRAKKKTLVVDAETAVPATASRMNTVKAGGYVVTGNLQEITPASAKSMKLMLMNDTTLLWNVAATNADSLRPFSAYAQQMLVSSKKDNVRSRFTDCLYHYYIGSTPYDIYGDGSDDDPLYANCVNLVDGLDFRTDAPFATAKATYGRDVTHIWSTLCLPYAFEVEGNGTCEFYRLTDKTDDQLVLTKIEDATVEAGTPVFVRRLDGMKHFDVNAENVDVVAVPLTTAGDNTVHLEGSFQEREVGKGAYIIADDRFWLVDNLVSDTEATARHKAFRAALCGVTGTRAASFGLIDAAQADDETLDVLNAKAEYYDLNGRRLPQLQKGVNIVKRGTKVTKVIIE